MTRSATLSEYGNVKRVDGETRCVDSAAATTRILDDRLLARMAGQRVVELELEAGEPVPVDADVPEHLCADRALRIAPAFLGIEAEARELEVLQGLGLRGIRLPLDVDE